MAGAIGGVTLRPLIGAASLGGRLAGTLAQRALSAALEGPIVEAITRDVIRHAVLERVAGELVSSDALEQVTGTVVASDAVGKLTDAVLAGHAIDTVTDRVLASGAIDALVEQVLANGVMQHAANRVLEGPEFERVVSSALDSPATERLVARVIESKLLDEAVERLLESEELWLLVDEIADSPAVTDAITQQSMGFADQVAGGVRSPLAKRRCVDRGQGPASAAAAGPRAPAGIAMSHAVRPAVPVALPAPATASEEARLVDPSYQGLVTRAIAFALDGAIINLVAIVVAAGVALCPFGAASPQLTRSRGAGAGRGGIHALVDRLLRGLLVLYW